LFGFSFIFVSQPFCLSLPHLLRSVCSDWIIFFSLLPDCQGEELLAFRDWGGGPFGFLILLVRWIVGLVNFCGASRWCSRRNSDAVDFLVDFETHILLLWEYVTFHSIFYDLVFRPCHGPSSVLEGITSRHHYSFVRDHTEFVLKCRLWGGHTLSHEENRCLAVPKLQEVTETFI
jgi:hypothetical protein